MKSNKHFYGIFLLVILSCCFFSCNKTVNDSAYISKLDIVDVSISAGQYDSAIKMLKKLENSALGSYQRLGIIKRYFQLSENQLAESYLKKSLKKLPDNVELNGVYAQYLLRHNRLEEAEIYAKKLAGTNFASIYSEVLFTKNLNQSDFFSPEYVQLYLDAAATTGENIWLKNAAAISAKNGDLYQGLSYKPFSLSSKDNPYFWALLEFDTENYVDALETLSLCDNSSESLLLESDCYLRLNEIDLANEFWTKTLASDKNQIPLEIFYNASKYAINEKNYFSSYELLTNMVANYPYSENALALYADYAFLLSEIKNQKNNSVVKTSLKTLEMEKIDSYPRIPLSDVMYKMNLALEKAYSSELLVEYLQTKWLAENYSEENVIIDIWNTLEKTTKNNIYDEYVLNFAISYFSLHHRENVAEDLFSQYISQKYGNESLGEYATEFDFWEAETAAWYCVKNKKFEDALRIYENLCFERNNIPSFFIQLNLGAVYNAMEQEKNALKIYGDLAGKNLGNKLASEVHFRIGNIQYNLKDKKNALLSLNYSIKLNPDNHKARLLLKKID